MDALSHREKPHLTQLDAWTLIGMILAASGSLLNAYVAFRIHLRQQKPNYEMLLKQGRIESLIEHMDCVRHADAMGPGPLTACRSAGKTRIEEIESDINQLKVELEPDRREAFAAGQYGLGLRLIGLAFLAIGLTINLTAFIAAKCM